MVEEYADVLRKVEKRKSGQANSKLTARSQWTLRCFTFLDSHIQVRTDTRQLGQVPQPTHTSESAEMDEDENASLDDPGEKSHTSQENPASNQPLPRQQKPSKAKSASRTADEALIRLADTFANRPSPSAATLHALSQETNDCRAAYCHWLRTESRGMTEEQWTAFMVETTAMVTRFRSARTQAQAMPPVMNAGMYGFQAAQRPHVWNPMSWQAVPGSSQLSMHIPDVSTIFAPGASNSTTEGQRSDCRTGDLVTAATKVLASEEHDGDD